MAEDKIKVDIEGDSSKFTKEAEKAQTAVGGIMSKIGGVKTLFVGAIAAAGAFAASLIKGSIASAAKLQDTQVQFEVLTGSVDKAKVALTQLQAFSARTPFQFDDVASAGRVLLSFGFAADDLTDKLQKIGDVAAASGTDLKEIALIYGQVAASGKLTGERLLQLQERGINIGPALAKSLGVAEKSVRDLVSKGKVDLEAFEKAFAALSGEGGFAFGGLDKQSQTLNGAISTMKDNWEQVSRSLGTLFIPVATEVVGWLTEIADSINYAFSDTKAQDAAGELVDRISSLTEELQKLEGRSDFTKNFLIGSLEYKKRVSEINDELKRLNTELDDIAKKQLKKKEEPQAKAQDETTKKLLEQENQYYMERGNLVDSFNAQRNASEATSEEERLAILQENLAIEKDLKSIARADELAEKGQFEEASAQIKELAVQREIEALDKSVKANQLAKEIKKKTKEEELAIYQSSFSQISSLQNAQNKSLVAVGKAAGIANVIISTNVGAAKALELGPIVGPILAGAIYAAGAVNAANIAGVKGFADGGIIGGIQGASMGGDNRMATVRDGEMVLNAGQQENLFNAINGGNLGGGFDVIINVNDDRFADAFEAKIVQRKRLGISRL